MRSWTMALWSLMDRGFRLGGLGHTNSKGASSSELPELKEGIENCIGKNDLFIIFNGDDAFNSPQNITIQ